MPVVVPPCGGRAGRPVRSGRNSRSLRLGSELNRAEASRLGVFADPPGMRQEGERSLAQFRGCLLIAAALRTGGGDDQAVRFVGSQRKLLHGWTSSQPSGGFPNLSTNRSDASASDSYWPTTDSIAWRAPSLRIASAAFRASSARLRQYSGLRSGMTFSATPRAAARQVGTRV
jgi:hypothetical protein